jgi:hypothetical protein
MASLTLDNLKRRALAPELALLNLKNEGFHIARITAQVLQFPQPNRQ